MLQAESNTDSKQIMAFAVNHGARCIRLKVLLERPVV